MMPTMPGRQREREVLDQQAIAVALVEALDGDDVVAKARAGRNDDLGIGDRLPLLVALEQLVIGLDTRLRLGLARLGAGADPLALVFQRPLLGGRLAAFLL
ncbi:MAG: hypothetical protein H6R00_4868 [Proteobacteria bacterium]|nr:hypothetical protein [Pseudomonadota bacterium]